MITRELLELVSREKKRKLAVKVAHEFTLEMGAIAATKRGNIYIPKIGKQARENCVYQALNSIDSIQDKIWK